MKYFIEHNQYIDAKGKGSKVYFTVYHVRKFLGLIPYRKYAEETVYYYDHASAFPLTFETEDLAETFIKEVLCAGIKTEKTNRYSTKEIQCVS